MGKNNHKSGSKKHNKVQKAEVVEEDDGEGPENISLFRNPFKTVYILLILIQRFIVSTLQFIISNIIVIVLISASILAFIYLPGPHEIVLTFPKLTLFPIVLKARIWDRHLCCMVGCTRYCKQHRVGDWSSHVCAVFGSSHSKGRDGLSWVQWCACALALPLELPVLPGMH